MEKTAEIPDGVEITINGLAVSVKGAKGQLSRDFSDPRLTGLIKIEKKDNKVHVSSVVIKKTETNKKIGAIVGSIAAHIRNMSLGVKAGYKYDMKVMYTHFPITVTLEGRKVQIKNFFGEKGFRTAEVVGDTEVKIDKEIITLTGINVEEIGQTAANIERACKLTGRDRRIFQDGIYLSGRHLVTGEKV